MHHLLLCLLCQQLLYPAVLLLNSGTRMCFAEQVLSTLQRAVMAGCCHTFVLAKHSDTCCVLESQLLILNGKLLSNSCEPYP